MIELVAMRPYLEPAVRIALALDHPADDCIYTTLAEAEGLRFVTAEASLVRKVGQQPSGAIRRPRDRFGRPCDMAGLDWRKIGARLPSLLAP
jgi:hypothetical protein